MCNRPRSSAQFRADRSGDQKAERTTIVGGRPQGTGQSVGQVPRGIELLLKKAAVDSDFRQMLLKDRAAAANAIGLVLDAAEKALLQSVPAGQLAAVIDRTDVPAQHRRALLGSSRTAAVAALADFNDSGFFGTHPEEQPPTRGIAPDLPEQPEPRGPDPKKDDPGEAEPSDDEPSVDPPADIERVSFGDRPKGTKVPPPDVAPD